MKCYHFSLCISDEQELKVFVDLAMISAGEDDREIDRISYMHTSCLAFGSLIFGYRQDLGFKELMKLCQPVWQAVDANPNINKKLVSFKTQVIFAQFSPTCAGSYCQRTTHKKYLADYEA